MQANRVRKHLFKVTLLPPATPAYITSAYIKKNAIAANASLLRCFCHNFLLYQK